MDTITSFTDEHRFLSNFWPALVIYDGMVFPTVEHAYQASKTLNKDHHDIIANCTTPGQAKRAGRKVTIRPDFEKDKRTIMYYLLLQKFDNTELREKLLATGDAEIIEGNTWGDTYWGVCNGKGQNNLGQLLMTIRAGMRSHHAT